MASEYQEHAPSRADLEALPGPTLLEFGSPTCGHCRRARPLVEAALAGHPSVRHLRIADGPGRRLGRSFGVRRWPTLVMLRDGKEVSRVVRPAQDEEVRRALAAIDPID